MYRLYRLQVDSKLPVLHLSYYLISVGMLIAAGIFAAAWEDNKAWK